MVVQQHRSGGGALAVCALAVVGVMAAASGCSGGGGDTGGGGTVVDERAATADPAGALHRAAAVLAGAGGARARTSMESAVGGTRVTVRGHGTYDFRRQLGRMKVVLPKDVAGQDEHLPITELLTPGALYMKNRGAGVPPDKWVRVDTTALADGNLVTGGVTDPMAAAELLRGARAVAYVGSSELAGERVWHFRGAADLAAAARGASPRTRGALAAAAKGFSTGAVPFDAYLDDAGRLRKVRYRFSYVTEGPPVEVVSTTLLYGFGTAVTVELPADGDIYTGEIRQPRTLPGTGPGRALPEGA
ncbi:hypothetical protein ACPXCE_25775 [Streptomyces sp. DT24]|uniref:hypothetical protein n=1 Tax=Streptomyces sp. DT24 TaxID=3416520 RepID=UPI003CEEC4C5